MYPIRKSLLLFIISICFISYTNAQTKRITGKVIGPDNEPLEGVTIEVKDDATLAPWISLDDGSFSFEIPNERNVLIFSYTGMERQEVNIAGQNIIQVQLMEDVQQLSDVVIVGYGTMKKTTLTGAVTSVSGKDISDLPVAGVSSALAGRIPGMSVVSSGTMPGSSPKIVVRGLGTFNNSSPLFVIDGVVRDQEALDAMDPNDIESVVTLKDAASAAVYGSRASNGVILVNTKKGTMRKPEISYKFTQGVESPTRKVALLGAYDKAIFSNDALLNMSGGDLSKAENDPRYFTPDELEHYKTNSYNWLDEAYKKPLSRQHNLSVNGGSEYTRYFISAGLFNQEGEFDNLEFDRYNVRSNVEVKLAQNLTFNLNVDGNIRAGNRPYWKFDTDEFSAQFGGSSANLNNLYSGLQQSSPYIPPYINGKPVGNIIGASGTTSYHVQEIIENGGYMRDKKQSLNGLISLDYKVPFLDGLTVKGAYSYNTNMNTINTFYKPIKLTQFATTGGHNHIITDTEIGTREYAQFAYDFLQQDAINHTSYQLNFQANYDKTFGDHHINGVLVYEQSEANFNLFSGQKQDLLSNTIEQFYIASADPNKTLLSGRGWETGRLSYVGRLNYAYAGKYIIESSFRYDGSPIFPPGNRWGLFPAVSGAWRISEESFFKDNISVINDLKLKGSWGLLGNDSVDPFQYAQNYSVATGPYFGKATSAVSSNLYPNANITWEKSRTVNFGFEAAFLSNRLTTGFDYFKKHTYDMLWSRNQTTPETFGIALPMENYGTVDVNGWEANANYFSSIGEDFTFSVGANVGYAKSNVTKIDVAPGTQDYVNPIGRPLNTIHGYVSTGIIRTPEDQSRKLTTEGWNNDLGVLSYADLYGPNGAGPDGVINSNDIIVLSERVDPRFNYGLSLNTSWKNISLALFFQGVGGWEKLAGSFSSMEARKDHYTAENTNAFYPRAYYGDGTSKSNSSFFLYNASFLRLKNVNLSYTLPSAFTSKVHMKNLRLFISGTNLLFVYDKIKFMDPETDGVTSYPLMKNISAGLNITF